MEISQTPCTKVCVVFSRIKPYVLMVALQFGSAGMYIISMATLNHGMSRFVLIVYRNAVAALAMAPFALLLERKIRPKITVPIFLKITALGFLEPILDQNLTYLGMQYTSASFTSAIMNAVPAVTFVMAIIFRLEHIKVKERRSQAKILGTLLTFSGALLMTVYKGPIIDLIWSRGASHHTSHSSADTHWIAGTLLILVGCCAWSAFYILQSITIKSYPAELSLATLICLMGAIQSAAIGIVAKRHSSDWAIGWDSRLLAPVYTGIISSGITYYVQGLVMKTRGPVFVTAFNPLCMVIVAALGTLILAEQLHLGSIIGAIIIAIGLYSVAWGKSKDQFGATPSPTEEKGEAYELPISATEGSKLVIEERSNGEQAVKK